MPHPPCARRCRTAGVVMLQMLQNYVPENSGTCLEQSKTKLFSVKTTYSQQSRLYCVKNKFHVVDASGLNATAHCAKLLIGRPEIFGITSCEPKRYACISSEYLDVTPSHLHTSTRSLCGYDIATDFTPQDRSCSGARRS